MTLRELVQSMYADEKLLIRDGGNLTEINVEDLVNDREDLHEKVVVLITWSQLFNAILIEVE